MDKLIILSLRRIIVASGSPDKFRQNGHLESLTLWLFLVATFTKPKSMGPEWAFYGNYGTSMGKLWF